MKASSLRFGPAVRQRGVLTLVVSLSILVLSTLVTFSVTKAILMEQKISNNELRAKQAFEAAEAGMLAAMDYISNDPDRDANGVLDPLVFDGSDADTIGDANNTTIGTAAVTVMVTDVSADLDMTSVEISAVGYSDDRSATRTVTQTMVLINPLPNAPQNPVVTRGSVIIGGSATVINQEGHSTIWSGRDVDLGSNNATNTFVPRLDAANYPICMDTARLCTTAPASSRNIKSVDVIESDSSLAALSSDAFFQNFFGMSEATYRASMVTIDTTGANFNTDADLATHEVIWVDGDTDIQGSTIGCMTSQTGAGVCPNNQIKPSIIIIDGDAEFTGTPQIYGILYVTGTITMSGNATIYGAVVTAGDASNSTGGSLTIVYDSSILAGTALAGNTSGSAGTWKDF